MTLAADLEFALGALADIAYSDDMTLSVARNKAKRTYASLRKKYSVDARDLATPAKDLAK